MSLIGRRGHPAGRGQPGHPARQRQLHHLGGVLPRPRGATEHLLRRGLRLHGPGHDVPTTPGWHCPHRTLPVGGDHHRDRPGRSRRWGPATGFDWATAAHRPPVHRPPRSTPTRHPDLRRPRSITNVAGQSDHISRPIQVQVAVRARRADPDRADRRLSRPRRLGTFAPNDVPARSSWPRCRSNRSRRSLWPSTASEADAKLGYDTPSIRSGAGLETGRHRRGPDRHSAIYDVLHGLANTSLPGGIWVVSLSAPSPVRPTSAAI